MKVICILKTKWNSRLYPGSDNSGPQFGETCTAHQCDTHTDAFSLEEYPYNEKGVPQSFLKTEFVPASDIDETEFVREYNKELV